MKERLTPREVVESVIARQHYDGTGCYDVIMLAAALILGLLACSVKEPPAAVFLVSLDTLRADHLGVYGDTKGLTPNLDRFAASAVVFEHAYSQSNVTFQSHASLFTSRYPSEIGRLTRSAGPTDLGLTLAEVLSLYGYQTGASTGGVYLNPKFGLGKGFQQFDYTETPGSFYQTVPTALAWLEQRQPDAPLFMFLHTYDPHAPYLKPSPFGHTWVEQQGSDGIQRAVAASAGVNFIYGSSLFGDPAVMDTLRHLRSRGHRPSSYDAAAALAQAFQAEDLTPGDLDYVRQVYQGAVAYTDAWFGLFLGALEDEGLLERALVIVFADHGESLGENGIFGHGFTVGDEELHVPLMIRLPGGQGGGRSIVGQVALLDVLPTVLDWAGIPPPAGIHGNSLLPFLLGEPGPAREHVVSEGEFEGLSVRSLEQRLVFTGVPSQSPFLPVLLQQMPLDALAYDASTTNDPDARAALRGALLAWREQLHLGPTTQHDMDPDALRVVQEQGYWVAP